MNSITPFRDVHKGETMLIVGNGVNLKLTPPDLFDFPSIGVNDIHLYNKIFKSDWTQDYYTCVDKKNMREYGKQIARKYSSIPKFVPSPRMEDWEGKNFYHFRNGSGGLLWPKDKNKRLWAEKDDMILSAWHYANITHVAIKLAYFMGAKTILIIGMCHEMRKQNEHFYGTILKMSRCQNIEGWLKGYELLSFRLAEKGVQLLNIYEDTFVPRSVIKMDSYEKWLPKEKEGTNG